MNRENIDILDSAFFCRDRGLSLIPLHGKKPLFGWKQFQSRRPTTGEIIAWFGPLVEERRNFAIVTGRISGVCAVDLDSPETSKWADTNLPPTDLITRTSPGKGHRYYRLPPDVEIRNRVRIKGRAIDIRGEGGYRVAAPSIHPDGDRYERLGKWNLVDVPEFPVESIDAEPTHISEPLQELTKDIRNLDAWLMQIESIQGQGGNKGLVRFILRCRDNNISPLGCMARLVVWNQSSGKVSPPWSIQELERAVENLYGASHG